jgi:hypothetical protein
MRRAAYAICTALCTAGLAGTTQAAPVTYTWEPTSSVPPDNGADGPAPTLSLSFTVNGNLSLSADNGFAPPATPPTLYPFPPQLLSFDLQVADLSVTLADFTSQNFASQTPKWSIGLAADPANGSASLSLLFLNATDTDEIYGPPPSPPLKNPAQLSTGALGTINFDTDFYLTDFPAQYTGMLIADAAPLPEPRSLAVLIAGLSMLALVRRRAR